jgi:hypothetical protein
MNSTNYESTHYVVFCITITSNTYKQKGYQLFQVVTCRQYQIFMTWIQITLNNSLILEPRCLVPLITKSTIGHNPESVKYTSHPHNQFPQIHLIVILTLSWSSNNFPHKNSVCIPCTPILQITQGQCMLHFTSGSFNSDHSHNWAACHWPQLWITSPYTPTVQIAVTYSALTWWEMTKG